MKKQLLIYAILAVLLTFSVNAACYDSDDGPKNLDTPARYIGIDGFVTEGNNATYYDACVSREGGSEIDDGLWIREYYCDNNGNMDYEDYFCPSHYYVECLKVHKAAACDSYSGPADYNETTTTQTNTTNTTNATNTTTNQTNTTTIPINCGDKKVEFGEECDPPGKECYTKALTKGVCDFNCGCDPAMTPELFRNLNKSLNKKEEENTTTASVNFNVTETKTVKENKTPAITGGIIINPIDDLIKEAKQPSENFGDSVGIKITSAITKAVMRVWNIIMNVIGG